MKQIFTTIFAKVAMVSVLATFFVWTVKATDFTLTSADSITKDGITISFAKGSGSNAPAWYSAGLRFYAKNTITISSSNAITNVTFSWEKQGSKDFATVTAGSGNYSHPTAAGYGIWTGSSFSIIFTLGSSGQLQLNKLSVTASSAPSSVSAPTFSPADGTNFGNDGLDVTISAANGTIYYTLDGSNPSTSSSVYSSAIHITATTTVKAVAADGADVSSVASATYTYIDPNSPGTQNNPYTVAQACAAIDAGTGIEGVYATGIVSEIVTAYNSQYGNISYNISSDGTTTSNQLQAYRGKSYNGDNFTSADDIQVGDVVVVYGNLTKYGSTYEFEANNKLVSLDRPVTPIISASDITIEHDATSGEIAYSVTNSSSGVDLEATTTAEWISNVAVTADKVTFTTTANEGDKDRTASFTLTYSGATDKIVTVTQKHFVADYATLPFAFDGGREDIADKAGLTQEGLGTDYTNSPKLKFDTANDCVVLKINETPGVLSFDIKGNPSSGQWSGTFKIQGSSDGVTYNDIKTYSSISSSKQSETIEQISANVHYIKWILVTRDNGNVALGNINLAKVDLTPSITVSSNSINAPAAETEETLNVTYKNVETSTGVDISWFESDGTTSASEPAWISAYINSSFNVDYLIEANKGAARTAYFKVYGLDRDGNDVYSELVTVSQEEYVVNYASLPFEYDGNGTGSIPAGLSVSGLGTYSSSPAMKFDGTGDYAILKIGEAPGTLSFDIKGNSFSGGTFKVQTSTNGENYTDLKSYTELGTTQNEVLSIASDVRYIKWIYTEKSSGNVALGNIKLAKPAADSYTINGGLSNGQYWASFYCKASGYTISDGAKAFTMNASNKLYLLGEGNVIPANTAVIIISDVETITLTKADNASATVSGGANILVGVDSDTAVSGISGTPYVLSIVNDTLGFYKYTGSNIPANKAYYIVNE